MMKGWQAVLRLNVGRDALHVRGDLRARDVPRGRRNDLNMTVSRSWNAGDGPTGAARLGEVDEYAWLVVLLASPLGRAFSGSVVTIDGGPDNWTGPWPPPDLAPEGDVPTEAPARQVVEKRRTGIEPASSAWKAEALPLSYHRAYRVAALRGAATITVCANHLALCHLAENRAAVRSQDGSGPGAGLHAHTEAAIASATNRHRHLGPSELGPRSVTPSASGGTRTWRLCRIRACQRA